MSTFDNSPNGRCKNILFFHSFFFLFSFLILNYSYIVTSHARSHTHTHTYMSVCVRVCSLPLGVLCTKINVLKILDESHVKMKWWLTSTPSNDTMLHLWRLSTQLKPRLKHEILSQHIHFMLLFKYGRIISYLCGRS